MAVYLPSIQTAYNISGNPIQVFPLPVVKTSNTNPSVTDYGTPGQLWVNQSAGTVFANISNAVGAASWPQITNSGGPGVFTTLTADGATNLNVATANIFNVLTGASSGAIHLNDGTGIGTITIGNTAAGALGLSSGAAVTISSALSAINAIVINASGAAGQTVIRSGTNGIIIGPDADTSIIDIANAVPSLARSVTISGGTVASAIADVVDIAPDGVNFAGSSKVVNIANDAVVAGSSIVNIGAGNVTAAQVNTVNIATGTGTSDINIGSTATDTVDLKGIFQVNDSINAAASINGGTSNGTISIGNAAAGAVTVDTAAGISLDAATASNFTSSLAASAAAVTISASAADGGITLDAGPTPGVTLTNGTQSAQILVGTGSPDTAVTASRGSIFLNVAGGADTILYVNTDGAQAWTALTST